MTEELWVCRLGLVDYGEALDLQERLRAARQAGAVPDVMLLLEHPPTYTRGRRSGAGDLPMGEDWYRLQGFEIVDVSAGGAAAAAGLAVGDHIVSVDGKASEGFTLSDLRMRLRDEAAGTVVMLQVKRGDKTWTAPVTLKDQI